MRDVAERSLAADAALPLSPHKRPPASPRLSGGLTSPSNPAVKLKESNAPSHDDLYRFEQKRATPAKAKAKHPVSHAAPAPAPATATAPKAPDPAEFLPIVGRAWLSLGARRAAGATLASAACGSPSRGPCGRAGAWPWRSRI